jgi:iron complex outermembrane recepter protein
LVVAEVQAYESYLGSGLIRGVVQDETGQPLVGATVILYELNTGTTTNADGVFEFRNLRNGVYVLQVKSMGYASATRAVELKEGHVSVVFTLQHTHIELREIVIRESSTGMVQSEQSLNITTANTEFFSQFPGVTLSQALQRIPGINSMDIGSGVSKPVIRGMGFNRLVVAENNIKQQGQQWGADHGLEIDFFGIERIEVIKGPASLLFGSDAMGGALNIRPAIVPQENTTRVELNNIVRSNNDLLGNSAMVALNRNGRFVRARVSHQDYADYRVPAYEVIYNSWRIPIPQQRLKNTSGYDRAFSLTSGIRKSWGISSLSVSNFRQVSGFFPATHGIPNPGALLEPGNPRQTEFPRQQANHFKVVSNTSILKGNNRFETDLGFQQNHRQELNPPHVHRAGPLPEDNVELDLLLNTFSGNARWHHRFSQGHTMVAGLSASFQNNTKGGYNFLLPDFSYGETGLFVISRWNIQDQLYLNAGIRADVAALSIQQYLEPVWQDEQTIISWNERAPRLERKYFNNAISTGVSWNINTETNLKANIGNSFRNPTAIELAANGIHHGSFRHEKGDTALAPERAWQLDLGLTYSLREFYLNISPFVNYFSNFLFLNPSGRFSELPGAGQIYLFEQAKAIHLGGEIYADWHISHELHTSVGAELIWAQNLDNNYALPFTPPPAIIGEVSYKWHDLHPRVKIVRILVSTRHAAAQNRTARNENQTQAYSLFNSGVNAQFQMGGVNFDAFFMVNNVFDTFYKNHISFYRILELPEPGRNFTVSLKSNFQW